VWAGRCAYWKATGVADKSYRGPQQELPGRPTKSTGVADKSRFGKCCKEAPFFAFSGISLLLFLFSCSC
jgi:hypothetical protein